MAQHEPLVLAQVVVLVVDDDRDNLLLLSTMLSVHGCLVRLAPTSQFALESARHAPPDVILLDIELPDLDGYAICEKLKRDPNTSAVPVIFLSARHATFDIVRAFAAGAVDYITKPFAAEEVLARVQVHTSVQRLQRQLQDHVAQLEHEIGERKLVEQALREREAQIRSIGDNLPNGMIYQVTLHADGRGEFSYISGAVERVTGYTAQQIDAQPNLLLDAMAEPDRARYWAAVAESARSLSVLEFESCQRAADGSLRWVQLYATPRRTRDDAIIWDGIHIDITANKQAERAAHATHERLETLVEHSPAVIFSLRPVGNFAPTFVSSNVVKLTGYRPEDFTGHTSIHQECIYPPDDPEISRSISRLRVDGHCEYEYRFRCADGVYRWMRAELRLVYDDEGQPQEAVGYWIDISKRRQAEAALRASEERYRRLFELSMDAIIVIDDQEIFLDANAAASDLFGIARETLFGTPIDQLSTAEGPNATELFHQYIVHGHDRGEFAFVRPDGTRRIAQYTAAPIGGDAHQAILRDVTDQKAAEAELERARLAAEEATRAKSEFVAQISHEIRTPMNSVIGLTTLLLASPLTPAQRDDVETIRRSGSALLTLIDDILDFSKIEAGKLTLEYHPFSLRECVEEALDLLAPLADAKQLVLRYTADPLLPGELIGDQARLRQILVNLLSNAVRFTERGEITVTLVGAARTIAADTLWDITLAIHDTGIGIAPEQLTRIFQPFVQTNSPTTSRYGGSGLGLTISRRLAEQMDGQIRAASALGNGSTFTVELTLAATSAPPPGYLAAVQPLLAGQCVLLLADHADHGATLVRQLELWQMLPKLFVAVQDALDWLRLRPPVDVILLAHDGMNAANLMLAHELRAAAGRPTLPIVLWAAVSQRSQKLDQIDHANTALLPLPIRPAMLHDTLLRLLRGGEGLPFAPRIDQIDATMAERYPLRILLAEDNTTNQQVARRLLAKLGYHADVAVNGLDVLETLKRQSYDLILMDIQMPEMSGTEATSYIRTFWPPERQPQIAAMTAYASEENRAWLLNIGMDDYIRKPVRIEELVRVLKAATPRPLLRGPADDRHPGAPAGTLDSELFSAFLASVSDNNPAEDAAFLASYVADMDAQVHTLREALLAGEIVRYTRAAHTLKGLCLQIGAMNLAIAWRRIEACGERGDTASSAELLHDASVAYTALRQTLAEREYGLGANEPSGHGGVR